MTPSPIETDDHQQQVDAASAYPTRPRTAQALARSAMPPSAPTGKPSRMRSRKRSRSSSLSDIA